MLYDGHLKAAVLNVGTYITVHTSSTVLVEAVSRVQLFSSMLLAKTYPDSFRVSRYNLVLVLYFKRSTLKSPKTFERGFFMSCDSYIYFKKIYRVCIAWFVDYSYA